VKYRVHNECPISCGKCCRYWRQALPHEVSSGDTCPHLGPVGCLLPRKERPYKCNEYLCRAVSAVLHGDLSLDDAKYLVSINEQSAHKWDDLLSAREVKG